MKTVTIAPVTSVRVANTGTSTVTTTKVVKTTYIIITTTYKTDTAHTSTQVSTTATATATSTFVNCPNFTPCPDPIGSTPFELIIYADVNTQWSCSVTQTLQRSHQWPHSRFSSGGRRYTSCVDISRESTIDN
jgi:hypothetical protein